MIRLKLYILLTICALFVSSLVFSFIPFQNFAWIKVLILFLISGGGFFFLVSVLDRYIRNQTGQIADLEEQVKEKRIKLKEDAEAGSMLSPLSDGLQDQLKVLSAKVTHHLTESGSREDTLDEFQRKYSTMVTEYTEADKDKNREIQSIQADYGIIAQNTNKAYTIADNLSAQAKSAFDLSGNVQEEVKVVNSVLHDTAEKSGALFEQSKKISKIIEIISEISSKTHILSINASIVSARAGKDGKAFEVVSKEIRKLATDTDKSLSEIETEILKIQDIIRSVVQGINEANSKTMEEQDLLTEVIGALQGVTLGVEVIRAVSNIVNTKTIKQKENIESVIAGYKKILEEITSLETLPRDSGHLKDGLDANLAELNAVLNALLEDSPPVAHS